jgi:polyisoprenoid-binding protein YceI
VAVDLRTLQTGIALRDEHLRDKYLEAGRGTSYAVSTLDQIRLASGDPAHPKGKTRFEGVLQLHGRKHPVAGTADIRPSGDGLRVEAIFPVSLSDFGIERATYLGVGVADAVTVTVSFKASVPRRP